MSKPRYFLATAWNALKESPGLSLLTVGTIATALVVVGAYIAALQNVENLALTWGRAAAVSVYLDDSTAETWASLRATVQSHEAVADAKLITPKAALEEFAARGDDEAALVRGVDPSILPASLELELEAAYAPLARVEALAAELESLDGIAEVDFGREEYARLQALLELLRVAGLAAGFLIVAATAFIVSNTIRLTVFARRDEIEILSLVGATRTFIRIPFLLEAAFWGLAGALLATASLFTADLILSPRISAAVAHVIDGLEVELFSSEIALILIVLGALLGVGGSMLAVGRFLVDGDPR